MNSECLDGEAALGLIRTADGREEAGLVGVVLEGDQVQAGLLGRPRQGDGLPTSGAGGVVKEPRSRSRP